MMETTKGKINPYDDVLRIVSEEMFGGISMDMKMSPDGKLFPDHIANVIEVAFYRAGRTYDFNPRQAADEAINKIMRGELMRSFFKHPVLAAPGLEKFLAALPRSPHGIITGDLRAVAKCLMGNNTYGNLRPHFPERLWTCGDDEGLTSRIDQLWSTYEKMGSPSGRLVLIDDAANGIRAMREFANKCAAASLVIGVLTGNYGEDELKKAGADVVLPNVGCIPDII